MIEVLDIELPTTANPAFTVPVSAAPQAIYFRTKCMTGTVAQNHDYDAWGFWATNGGTPAQCSAGYQYVDNTVADNPHCRCNTTGCLIVEDHAGGTLVVSVVSVSATEITLNCSGSLLAGGVRVIAWAISGITDAWCGAYQIGAYPIQFTSGWTPDLAFHTQIGARPDDIVFVSSNSAVQTFGVMNATNQASVSKYIDSSSVGQTAQAASQLDLGWWMNRDGLLEQFYGEFNATGLEVKTRSTNDTTSSVQTQLVLLLKDVDSTIQVNTTVSGSIPHTFTHQPEALVLVGSGNNLWDTYQTNANSGTWGQMSQAISSPGTPPTSISVHSGGDSATTGRLKHRNNTDGACWGLEGAATPTAPINKYRGEITQFDGQAAETTWTLDGTGAPAGAFPFFLVAFNAMGSAAVPLNMASIDARVSDVPMELLPESAPAGGAKPFGPGVFR